MTPHQRIDSASRIIAASVDRIFQAFVDPASLVQWLPPHGMTGQIAVFDPRPGGRYQMTLTYDTPDDTSRGKTSENADVVGGTFLEIVHNERIVQNAKFESDDPAFAGSMTITWSFIPVAQGTSVTVSCENVPAGIRPEDHEQGLQSSLANLAAYTEK